MADVHGRPFLSYIFDGLAQSGLFSSLVVSVGYMKESITNFFGNAYRGMSITYSVENEPLGTGGAVALALTKIRGEVVYVLNGDSLFEIDFQAMLKVHNDNLARVSMAVKQMTHVDRYGTLDVKHGRIQGFYEKQYRERALINGGIYLIDRLILGEYKMPLRFSLESDFFEREAQGLQIVAFQSDGYFIDIGIPEDYEKFKAKKEGEQHG